MKIITRNDRPPIPTTAFDWSAVLDSYDGPGSPHGHGATEQAAIDDLKDQIDWYEWRSYADKAAAAEFRSDCLEDR